jgi:hypothetical protein
LATRQGKEFAEIAVKILTEPATGLSFSGRIALGITIATDSLTPFYQAEKLPVSQGYSS